MCKNVVVVIDVCGKPMLFRHLLNQACVLLEKSKGHNLKEKMLDIFPLVGIQKILS